MVGGMGLAGSAKSITVPSTTALSTAWCSVPGPSGSVLVTVLVWAPAGSARVRARVAASPYARKRAIGPRVYPSARATTADGLAYQAMLGG
jgi:hypothetical protein